MTDDEVISDVYFKDVVHTTNYKAYTDPELVYIGFPSNRWSNNWMICRLWAFENAPVGLPTMDSVGVSTLATKALRLMMPSMNEGTSIINFTLELKDLRRDVVKWKKRFLTKSSPVYTVGAGKAANKGKYVTKQNGGKTDVTVREATKFVAGEYLSYMFGWAPFFSDLKGIYDGLKKFERKLAWLRSHQGKVLKRQYRRMLPGYEDFEEEHIFWMGSFCSSVPNNSLYPLKWRRKITWDVPPQYHATLIYRYTMPEMSEAEAKVKGFLDMLGIRFDLSTIWNAIRLSFLVDWVVDVSSWLRSFSVDNLGIKTEVIDFCHSVKASQLSESYCTPFRYGYGPLFEIQTVQAYRTRYERKRANPDLHALTTSGINLREAVLGTALVLANQRTNKRVRPSQASTGKITDDSP